ncbi:hypothetical protein P9112_011630 [Eukaryota sp. TZLM1-RC]
MVRSSIQRLFQAESSRVKCIDFHDTQPLVLCALYDGSVTIYNYNTSSVTTNITVSNDPVRAARWIPSHHGKPWILTASDDGKVRVFNTNTSEKVKTIAVSPDYLRAIAVHPSDPTFIVAGDDMLIRSYTWQGDDFALKSTFEGHGHYVMSVSFNPNEPSQFASGSLDNTAKVWSLHHKDTLYTLSGHTKGIDDVSFFPHSEFPYLATSADDFTIKVWDTTNRVCVKTLEHHTNNVSAIKFHPKLPLLISGSEDGSVCIFDVPSFEVSNSISYGMNRIWSLDVGIESSTLAIGADDGSMVVKLASDLPTASLGSDGRIVLAKEGEVRLLEPRRVVRKGMVLEEGASLDIEAVRVRPVDFGVESVLHRPEGRFVTVVGEGKYSIFSSLALAPQENGKADLFCWAVGRSGVEYGIVDGSRFLVFSKATGQKDFNQRLSLSLKFSPSFVFSGPLIAAATESFVCFYDWESGEMLQRIDVAVSNLVWNNERSKICIYGPDGLFMLNFNEQEEEIFEVEHDLALTTVQSVTWVSESALILTQTSPDSRILFWTGGKPLEIEKPSINHVVLGWFPDLEVYLTIDKNGYIYAFVISKDLIVAFNALSVSDFDVFDDVMSRVKGSVYAEMIVEELESRNEFERALSLTSVDSKKLDLSLKTQNFEQAVDLAVQINEAFSFKSVGIAATQAGYFDIGKQMMLKSNDLPSCLVLGVCLNDVDLINYVKSESINQNDLNSLYLACFLTRDVEGCLNALESSGLVAEAAHFVRTFDPKNVEKYVQLWKNSLAKTNPRVAESLVIPQMEAEFHSPRASEGDVDKKEDESGGEDNDKVDTVESEGEKSEELSE